jgi:hypothetical protein
VGPFQAAGTAEVDTITPSGTWSGGTYTLTVVLPVTLASGSNVLGTSATVVTGAIAYNASTATVQTTLNAALLAAGVEDTFAVSGSALSAGAMVFTHQPSGNASNITNIAIDTTLVTGTTPSAAVAQTTAGVAGAVDGRQTSTNIVGLCNTFLPWQLIERDVEISVLYAAAVIQANCFEMNAAGTFIALTNTTAGFLFGVKNLRIIFAR